jgi:hypothetical protein
MTMLLLLLIGWVVLLPALIVGGLYLASSLLGRRRELSGTYDDLFSDEVTLALDATVPTTMDAIALDPRAHAGRVG